MWAKNAPGVTLPKDVAFKLDRREVATLIVQVHYAKPLKEKDYTGFKFHYHTKK